MRRLAVLIAFVALPVFGQFKETVTVERILLDVRVTQANGEAVTDLTADDFEVKIGGRKAEVLSATWIADGFGPLAGLDQPENVETAAAADPPGRLFVYFIQTDFARNATRIGGQMHFLQFADELLEGLGERDRVAVFSFDSHLKFRLDFSDDKDRILAAMKEALLIDEPDAPPIVPSPSLARRLDAAEMKRAADSEDALLIVANALRNIPGPKTVLLMGWGLGQLTSSGVRMKPRYRFARQALDAARATIFALDTTMADYHSLEVGLETAARDTGGFYAKTHIFPQLAVDRLQRTLVGHYELELRRPESLRPGTHEVDVRVKRRNIDVLAPGSWMDR